MYLWEQRLVGFARWTAVLRKYATLIEHTRSELTTAYKAVLLPGSTENTFDCVVGVDVDVGTLDTGWRKPTAWTPSKCHTKFDSFALGITKLTPPRVQRLFQHFRNGNDSNCVLGAPRFVLNQFIGRRIGIAQGLCSNLQRDHPRRPCRGSLWSQQNCNFLYMQTRR